MTATACPFKFSRPRAVGYDIRCLYQMSDIYIRYLHRTTDIDIQPPISISPHCVTPVFSKTDMDFGLFTLKNETHICHSAE